MKQESLYGRTTYILFFNIVKAHMFGGKVVILFQAFSMFCKVLSLHTNY